LWIIKPFEHDKTSYYLSIESIEKVIRFDDMHQDPHRWCNSNEEMLGLKSIFLSFSPFFRNFSGKFYNLIDVK